MESNIRRFYNYIKKIIATSISKDGKLCMDCPYYRMTIEKCDLFRTNTPYGHRKQICKDYFVIDIPEDIKIMDRRGDF
jgi:hypothetical protein